MRQKASKNGPKRPKAMNQVSKGLMGSPSTPKVRDVVIGLGKPKRLSYGNAKLEWAEDA